MQLGDAALTVVAFDYHDASETGDSLTPLERAMLKNDDCSVDVGCRLIHRLPAWLVA